MPILPSIRAISPLSNTVTAQAQTLPDPMALSSNTRLDREPSMASHQHHSYREFHKQGQEKTVGNAGPLSPPSSHKEGFFSHLRKKARRFSGRPHSPLSPAADPEADDPWASWRLPANHGMRTNTDLLQLDQALQNAKHSLDTSTVLTGQHDRHQHPCMRQPPNYNTAFLAELPGDPVSNERSNLIKKSSRPNFSTARYDIPNEQDELMHDALASNRPAATHMDQQYPLQYPAHSAQSRAIYPEYGMSHRRSRPSLRQQVSGEMAISYPSPSPSAQMNNVHFSGAARPIEIALGRNKSVGNYAFPTPPYEENEWAAAAAASISAVGDTWR